MSVVEQMVNLQKENFRLERYANLLLRGLQPSRRFVLDDGKHIDVPGGWRYVGAILDKFGELAHHVIVLTRQEMGKSVLHNAYGADYQTSQEIAKKFDGVLPSERESLLLMANAPDEFEFTTAWIDSHPTPLHKKTHFVRDFEDGARVVADPKDKHHLPSVIRRIYPSA